jgi:acetoin:2,6-dichlorophenolindophenol oxidoreductase subunit alpha
MKLTKEQMLKLYINMVRVRKLDELMVKGLLTGKIVAYWHSQIGQEALGVGACTFLRKDDYVFMGHRGHGISKALSKGVSPKAIIAEHYCRTTGLCGGISGFHISQPELGIPGHGAILGAEFVLTAGTGIAARLRGKGQVAICFQGDGTHCRGPFHEAMIMSSKWKLPVIDIIENNQYFINTPVSEVWPMENLADLAMGYHVPGVVVDGQDVAAVYEAVQTAVDRARAGEGPSVIECKTYRIRAHNEGSRALRINQPRPQEEVDAWAERDPIKLFGARLLKEGMLTQAEIDRIDREATEEMDEAERQATADPVLSDPSVLEKALYAE